jgi:hypothetical protein
MTTYTKRTRAQLLKKSVADAKYRAKKRRDTDAYLPLANMLREVFEFMGESHG